MSKSIGQRIRELRDRRELTQGELAHLIGCAQNTIAAWENQEGRAPNKRLLAKIAQVLGVSSDYLLGVTKLEHPQIPCYGEIFCKEFVWPTTLDTQYHIEVPPKEYFPARFSFKIFR